MVKNKWNFRNVKWEYYIWLLYMPYNISFYLPIKSATDAFWIVMCLGFLADYIWAAEKPEWQKVSIPLEILITGIFTIVNFNFYMMVFTAWQVAFLIVGRPKKYVMAFLGRITLF